MDFATYLPLKTNPHRLLNLLKYPIYLLFLAICFSASAQSGKFKVALDAGHGGKDFGATYNGHIEKNISLAVAQKVGKILESTSGFQVIYTRQTDVFIELVERANIANRADANIFVSIHCNANKNAAAEGTETYVMGMTKNASNLEAAKRENSVITLEKDYKEKYEGFDPNSPETMIGMELMQEEFLDNSITLASKIQDIFVQDLNKKSRGVKQAPYMVLHKAYMPRVLIEMGFISNLKDGSYLDSEEGQDEIAKSIAKAIVSYKKEYYGNGNVAPVGEKPSERIPDSAREPQPTPTPTTSVVVEKPVEKPVAETSQSVTPKTVVPAETVEPASASGTIIFKVQISASGRNLPLTPSNFNGLGGVSMSNDGGKLYKYFYGETSDYGSAKDRLAEAKAKGFTSAYIVAFRNGQKIPLNEALK
ncbi:N-acetylmuramoyl-L-alanine amidase family protein [Flavobacterium silvaticum]|uniref:N-acetylmuramoyl-L-alanine amidase n=1 Tax=Flavobacterium silvaticum TaxID=1852020 RepID=A0A972JHA5_9FLAO|nr:N-acetylmuramoyl-L-alanine amidase [Flavobacterium silvaticum]NMH29036.1 N-acetylmuramoyl-L-alanine amidase [Flavobacterium silvaticum]